MTGANSTIQSVFNSNNGNNFAASRGFSKGDGNPNTQNANETQNSDIMETTTFRGEPTITPNSSDVVKERMVKEIEKFKYFKQKSMITRKNFYRVVEKKMMAYEKKLLFDYLND